MIRRTAALALTAVVLAGCGSSRPTSATSRENPPPHLPVAAHSPARAIAGAGVGAREFAAVQRLARRGLPVFCGGLQRRMIALTFDDGPGPYTHYVLKRLRRNHMRATFFLNTKNFARFAGLIPRELRYGTVGDHTANHVYLPALGDAGLRSEIDGAQAAIGARAGFPITLFRPPYGAHTPAIDAHVRQRRMLEILWNVDSRDSLGASWSQIRRHVIAWLRPGMIILMHDNRGQTVRALPDILHAVRHKHLQAVTIPELIAHDPPSARQLRAGPKGCPGTR